jgi:hypothetical protein
MEIANNDVYIELFLHEVEKTINSGNIVYIKNAIHNYSNYIDTNTINWANSLILEIIKEKIETIEF